MKQSSVTTKHNRHPEEPRACAASRRTDACARFHPSRLAEDGEHLRMTSSLTNMCYRHPEEPRACAASRRTDACARFHPSRLAEDGEHLRMTSSLTNRCYRHPEERALARVSKDGREWWRSTSTWSDMPTIPTTLGTAIGDDLQLSIDQHNAVAFAMNMMGQTLRTPSTTPSQLAADKLQFSGSPIGRCLTSRLNIQIDRDVHAFFCDPHRRPG
jgi:hypothetical protein